MSLDTDVTEYLDGPTLPEDEHGSINQRGFVNPFVNNHNAVVRWLRNASPDDVVEACFNFTKKCADEAYAKGKADMAKEMIEQVPKYELNLSQTPTIKALYGGWNSCVDRLISYCQLEQVSGAGEFDNADVSLCASCHCVTHTIDGTCGKCQQPKTLNQVSK
jgi:hypothetical protein